jgi:5-methylthioadenosine/S-adenosylhomocysteine deaminase
MTAIDLLVSGDFLYPMSEGLPIVEGGEVAVAGGRIVYAGPRKPDGTWRPARTLGGPGKAVLPGFVNAHCHTASLVFRSQTDDFSGGVALYTVAFRMEKEISEDEWHDLAALGCIDMLKSGVTTINDI